MQIKPGAPMRLQHPPDRRRPPALAHAIAAEAARKAPKCPACLLADTVLHPYGWSKQGGATDKACGRPAISICWVGLATGSLSKTRTGPALPYAARRVPPRAAHIGITSPGLRHRAPAGASSANSLVRSGAPCWLFGAVAPRTQKPVRFTHNRHRSNTRPGPAPRGGGHDRPAPLIPPRARPGVREHGWPGTARRLPVGAQLALLALAMVARHDGRLPANPGPRDALTLIREDPDFLERTLGPPGTA